MKPGRSAWSPRSKDPRGRPFERQHLVQRSGGHDGFAADCHCFDGGLLGVHRNDVVAVEDRVHGVGLGSARREKRGEDESENEEGPIGPALNSFHDFQGRIWAAYGCTSGAITQWSTTRVASHACSARLLPIGTSRKLSRLQLGNGVFRESTQTQSTEPGRPFLRATHRTPRTEVYANRDA